jgi:16S rRNA (cytosine967-C5)-methyltransferase
MSAKNPRLCCVTALQRWESGREFADEVLHQSLQHSGLNNVNRAFVTETFYGVIRHRSLLDFVIQRFRQTGLDVPTRQVLRLGIYQLYKMRIPDHAAVYETVNVAGPARTLVNAVLRRAIAERSHVLAELETAPFHIRYSHPEFLWTKWETRLGLKKTEQLCDWNNQPARIYVRVNRLKVTPGELIETLPTAKPLPDHEDCLEVDRLPLFWLNSGVAYAQDPSTLMACELLQPQPNEAVLDACAAPGGKTGYLAQLMQNQGHLVACDYDKTRLQRLEQNLSRLGALNLELVLVDWLHQVPALSPNSFDAVLLDAPCTNTGVIRRRTDVRWRLTPLDFQRMQRLQLRILEAVLPYLKSGGRLVYSTCSLEPEENEDIIAALPSELEVVTAQAISPIEDGYDGAYAALCRKR